MNLGMKPLREPRHTWHGFCPLRRGSRFGAAFGVGETSLHFVAGGYLRNGRLTQPTTTFRDFGERPRHGVSYEIPMDWPVFRPHAGD